MASSVMVLWRVFYSFVRKMRGILKKLGRTESTKGFAIGSTLAAAVPNDRQRHNVRIISDL
jgi:hypothetical protein